jgi:transcriptional regulator with XRE-family HTH domain
VDEAKIVALVVGKLRATREKRGISQYRLAKDSELSASGLRHMEKGDVSPTLHFLLIVSGYLELDLAQCLAEAQVQAAKKTRKKS